MDQRKTMSLNIRGLHLPYKSRVWGGNLIYLKQKNADIYFRERHRKQKYLKHGQKKQNFIGDTVHPSHLLCCYVPSDHTDL